MPYPLSRQIPQVFSHPNNNHGTSFGVGKQPRNTATMRTGPLRTHPVAQPLITGPVAKHQVTQTTSKSNCFIPSKFLFLNRKRLMLKLIIPFVFISYRSSKATSNERTNAVTICNLILIMEMNNYFRCRIVLNKKNILFKNPLFN